MIEAKSKLLPITGISLAFASQVTWNLESLANDVVDWLNNPLNSKTSKVGTLSSPEFFNLIKTTIAERAGFIFQRMIYAISLAYTQVGDDYLSASDMHQIGCMAGHGFLQFLDERLKPQSLKSCSGNDLRTLFLIVFGTILAVSYVGPIGSPSNSEQQSQFKAMQNHLCQILAHYLIYLGSHLKLPIASGTDQFILEAAPTRWNKRGFFSWGPAKSEGFGGTSESYYSGSEDEFATNIGQNSSPSHYEPSLHPMKLRHEGYFLV